MNKATQTNDQTKKNNDKTTDVDRLANGKPWYETMISRPISARIPRPIAG